MYTTESQMELRKKSNKSKGIKRGLTNHSKTLTLASTNRDSLTMW